MILIINICKEKLHYYEFVKPIEDILKKNKIKFNTVHYLQLTKDGLEKYNKIIICGTSLRDNRFIEDFGFFKWIKNFENPVLGICGGMQIIQLVFGGKFGKEKEIGFYKEKFKKEFLGLKGEIEVYHLHNNYASLPKDFEEFTSSKIPQAIKQKSRMVYGVLFHPEVRNKEVVERFVML